MWWPCICIAARLRTRLSDEDLEQDPERWASHAAPGQEGWQIVSQWVWNLRLELGSRLLPDPVRTTELPPAPPGVKAQDPDAYHLSLGDGPAVVPQSWN